MGVAGLWDLIRPAGQVKAWSAMTFEAFESTDLRALTLGIDASIWAFHANFSQGRTHPELRMHFFRLARLLRSGAKCLFVFDGPHKPTWKRGQRVGTQSTNTLVARALQAMIVAFGFEWIVAPGEAEAELAYLNSSGTIDAIMTDDVDAFVFGAHLIWRNWGTNLSGKDAKGKQIRTNHSSVTPDAEDDEPTKVTRNDDHHVTVYSAERVLLKAGLDRDDMILIALLCGGDYDTAGLLKCGPTVAAGLTRCGYGKELMCIIKDSKTAELSEGMKHWRERLQTELRTNASGELGRRYKVLADSITPTFPRMDVLMHYVRPATTACSEFASFRRDITWTRAPDIEAIVRLCVAKESQQGFEWTHHELLKYLSGNVYPGLIMHELRLSALELPTLAACSSASATTPLTPSRKLARQLDTLGLATPKKAKPVSWLLSKTCRKIVRTRKHHSTDDTLEYRVEIDPSYFVEQVKANLTTPDPNLDAYRLRKAKLAEKNEAARAYEQAMAGAEASPSKTRKATGEDFDADAICLVWLPQMALRLGYPALVEAYEEAQATKAQRSPSKKDKQTKKKETMKQTTLPGSIFAPKLDRTSSSESSSSNVRPSAKPTASNVLAEQDTDSDIEIIGAPVRKSPIKVRQRSLTLDSMRVAPGSPSKSPRKSSKQTSPHKAASVAVVSDSDESLPDLPVFKFAPQSKTAAKPPISASTLAQARTRKTSGTRKEIAKAGHVIELSSD
ncbi:uncharacterized protein L969DRAFT_92024 [Mixia osmundae IAM 14324]|uniref:XPG-I domain-containing protein n=1 Tax=Mixia osmundae (strain CBS 9802 / IAM 14324 / JCM 22182 / KY 12970) TaxID=764103 RepID=G7DZD7_MIXOS|nr:uncharacterized protein L969DRAFT_92024 [Mixia osmundae IAM 14324]KEI42588.1 hypothetical protein L969DRAFT_92024 [Mixia osmundae IAM 14324]GAA95947.1 hypothetical protein E5Q_02605 [Mixia osmundae IAM 14324]